MNATALIFGSFALFLLLNVPIAISIGLSSICYIYFFGGIKYTYLATTLFTANDSFPLMAIPFFILSGALMEGGGLSRKLCNIADSLVGHMTGGFAIVTIITCTFFGAISGSAPATVAAIGVIMVPEMVKQGYSKPFSYGLIAASGILGILIPPSIPMVMFGVATNTSTSAMFMGGFGPGILSALLLIVATLYISKKRGYKGNEQKNINWKKVWRSLTEGVWALFVPIIILGGIYGGIFTPTEAAAIAVIYGFFVGKYIYRELTFKKINTCLIESAVTTSTILIIVGTATTLARILTLENIPFLVQKYLLNLSDNRWVIILAINLILLLTGCFMDSIAAIMVLSPIFLPIVLKLGFDPIHFGLILVLNLGIGLITPPVGVNLFVASGIGEIDFIRLVVGVIPFLIALLVSLFFVTLIPGITTAIPRLMGF